MTTRRRRMRTFVNDINHDAPSARRARIQESSNFNNATHLMHDNNYSSGLSRSSVSHERMGNTDCGKNLDVSRQEDTEPNSDTCAICLMPRTDQTLLDGCDHSFCYICTSQWLKHSGKCPLCMTAVNSFWHRLDLPPRERPMILVAELRAAAEAVRLAERGRSLPPLDERECIKLRIRRLERRLRCVQEQMSKSTRIDRSSELASTNKRLVNEISRLDMLKRDATTRSGLVGNITFRSLIYKDNLDWCSIDRNANRVAFSPEVFNANSAVAIDRLRPFVDRELKIVWRTRNPKESREEYESKHCIVVSSIIQWCSEFQINSPQFTRNLRLAGVFPLYLERFQTELFEFASSMLSLEDFDSMSAYSSKELRQLLRRRNRRAENTLEIVTLSESDSDSAVILSDSVPHADHNRNNDDVIVLSDDNHSGAESILAHGESNYVMDEATSSNSEASNFGDFYRRPACCISLPTRPPPIRVVDSFGSSREVFPRSHTLLFSTDSSDASMNSVPKSSTKEHLHTTSTSLENAEITIILSSDDEGGAVRDLTKRRRIDTASSLIQNRDMLSDTDGAPCCEKNLKRANMGSSQLVNNSSSLSSEEIYPLMVGWLSPSNAEERRIYEQYKQELASCIYPNCRVDMAPIFSRKCVDNCSKTTLEMERPTSSKFEASLSELSEENSSQCNAQKCVESDVLLPSTCYNSSECSISAASTNCHTTSQCSISANSLFPEVTSCGFTSMSLFRPAPERTAYASNQVKGENELLASLWKERQQRLANLSQLGALPCSSTFLVEEQQEKQKMKADLSEKTSSQYCGQETVKTSTNNPVLNEAVAASADDVSISYQSSWNSSNLVNIPSSSKCVESGSSASDIQTVYDRNISQVTMRSKRARKKKYSWKFLFKQFRRKLCNERSHRKCQRLYDFMEEMKQKLDDRMDDEKSSKS